MLDIKNVKVAVQLEDYILSKFIDENNKNDVLNIQESKEYYNSLKN